LYIPNICSNFAREIVQITERDMRKKFFYLVMGLMALVLAGCKEQPVDKN